MSQSWHLASNRTVTIGLPGPSIASAIIVVTVGAIAIQFVSTDDNREAMEIVFTDIVAVLSFPAGLLSGYLLFGFHDLIENSALPEILGGGSGVYWIYAVSAWSLFLILGYLQWFLILPYAARKLLRFWERRRLGT